MKNSMKQLICVVLLCASVWHVAGCRAKTGKVYFFASGRTMWGFGSDEAETVPVKDGTLWFESVLLEEVVRDKMNDGPPIDQPPQEQPDVQLEVIPDDESGS